MAYDGWLTFGGTEIVNLSRTTQLASVLGIDTVWVTEESVQWIETELGGSGYDDPSNAPWFDPMTPASEEFAGIIPLSLSGIDDSTMESSVSEYITDGGSTGKPRSKTLSMVANVAIVASTDRGADYGLRWLNRVLRRDTVGSTRLACTGYDLRYFRFRPDAGDTPPRAYRRNVRLTRGSSVTRKRRNACSSTWLVTFTLTAADPFEYGDKIPVLDRFGDPEDLILAGAEPNLAANPRATMDGSQVEFEPRFSWVRSHLVGLSIPALPFVSTAVRFTPPAGDGVQTGRGFYMFNDPSDPAPGVSGPSVIRPVAGGETVTASAYVRPSLLSSWAITLRTHDGAGNWTSLATRNPEVVIPNGQWVKVEHSFVAPAGSQFLAAALHSVSSDDFTDLDSLDATGLVITSGPTEPGDLVPSGAIALVQQTCPKFDYSPVYDPLFPALVAPPTAPEFLPLGWNIQSGMTFDRQWAVIPPSAPTLLTVVPVLELTTDVDARMIRVSVWSWNGEVDGQCDPLWSAVVTFVPANDTFFIDGVERACYVWDGQSPEVRRADSLVFSDDGTPVEWGSFSTADSLLVTLDTFVESGEVEGDGTIRASLSWVQKSD